ncbi:thioredoxin-like domain-containing protein [Flavitalea flava]
MKKSGWFLSLLFAYSGYAQEKLHLNAEISGLPNDSVVYLTGFAGEDFDSTYVKDHRFRFDRVLKEGGDVYTIKVGKNQTPATSITLYLGPGEVHIKGNWSDPGKAVITGSSFVREWKEVQEMKRTMAATDGDKTSRQKKLAELGKHWVSAHPNSGVSAYVIEAYISLAIPRNETKSWVEKLTPEALNNAIGKELKYRLDSDIVVKAGHQAPLFSAPDTLDRPVALSAFRGKYVLLDFWASWCGSCREMNPYLVAMYNKCKDRNFTIVSISIDQSKKAWLDAVHKDALPWTQVLEPPDYGGRIKRLYHIIGVPANFLIDPNGLIIGTNIAEINILEGLMLTHENVN